VCFESPLDHGRWIRLLSRDGREEDAELALGPLRRQLGRVIACGSDQGEQNDETSRPTHSHQTHSRRVGVPGPEGTMYVPVA
jgi:hypothetical protein